MNTQEYISSGIVESYVLGLADEAERAEFERMSAAHAEVREARDAFEILLEQQVMLNQVEPSAKLKNKIFSTIGLEAGNVNETGEAKTRQDFPPFSRHEHSDPGQARVINSSGMAAFKRTRFLAAAAVILLLLSTALNFYFFSRYKEYNDRYQALVLTQTQLVQHNEVLQTRLVDYEKAVEMMKDPYMAIIKMPAIPKSPDPTSATTVYWDTRSKDVYLAINKLPTPSKDQQYQLWAMVDGKPVDAGVFDIKDGAGMVKMKNIPKAQAFAVTLEKRGGSPVPNLENLYVMGKV